MEENNIALNEDEPQENKPQAEPQAEPQEEKAEPQPLEESQPVG